MEFSTADLARYRAQLQAAMPDFTIDRFNYLGQGWDNILFVVNGDLIARFAKDVRAATQLVAESVLLQLLHISLPVRIPIPEVIAQATDGRNGTLNTYRLIPGLPLDSISLTDELVAAIAP